MLYHVSAQPGLTVLQPHISSHGTAYVYAVEQLTTGLLFGARHDDFDFLLSTDPQGVPVVCECYPGAFRSVYEGKSCSVYQVGEEGFLRGKTSWEPELVCPHPVPVQRETVVPDLYRRLLEEQAAGRLLLRPYASDIGYRRLIAGHLVDRLVRFDVDLASCMDADPRFARHFGGLVRALAELMDGSLLPQVGDPGQKIPENG